MPSNADQCPPNNDECKMTNDEGPTSVALVIGHWWFVIPWSLAGH
jgi:hypothetical protein